MHSRLLRCTLASLSLVLSTGALASGCLSRPVVPGEPVTKTNFTTNVQEQAVDKLDILFSIDNSASMGDKQAFLQAAIPDLINRLVTPYCLDNATGATEGPSTTNGTTDGICPSGQTVEFPPVHDMHIGIVSSSLGPRLGDQAGTNGGACLPTATTTIGGQSVPSNNDDHAHLLNRTGNTDTTGNPVTGTSTDAPAPDNFLAWFPTVTENNGKTGPTGVPAITSSATLISDFSDLVGGIQWFGCGIESQLENWYRFLIQPDPYATLALNSKGLAQWVGVDTTILQQRKDFLRPDSLVTIIVLTDENDSEIDVRSLAGQGYLFMSTAFDPPCGTSACASNPGSASCQSCQKGSTDPGCTATNCPYTNPDDWGFDLNLRHVHMKAKYGLDPQFPISRYVNGLTSTTVPDRTGEYPSGANSYVGTNDCTNPLFAAELPDPKSLATDIATTISAADAKTLCKLTPGTRATNLVFYTIIGGVPHQLLHFDPTSAANSELTSADWVKILGTDPDTYNYAGIDPHMVESQTPRNGTPADPNNQLSPPTAANNADPINGREWITNVGPHKDLNVDREYACIFPLATPRDCTNPDNALACDCSSPQGTLPNGELSPVCDATVNTQQDYAKAYPTIRELNLAHKLGAQGIVSSICPIDTSDNAAKNDPLYGYRPAVATIINRLKSALTNECLPQKLTPDPTQNNEVPCLILATLPTKGDESACTATPGSGLSIPDATVLSQFRASAETQFQQNGGADAGLPDPALYPVCQVNQVVVPAGGSCKGGSNGQGWCYVTGTAAGSCQQAILFAPGVPPSGSTISLQCIESAAAPGEGDGG